MVDTKIKELQKMKNTFSGYHVIVTTEDEKEVKGVIVPKKEEKEIKKYYDEVLKIKIDYDESLMIYTGQKNGADGISLINFEGIEKIDIRMPSE